MKLQTAKVLKKFKPTLGTGFEIVKNKQMIYLSNHVSYLDPILLSTTLPDNVIYVLPQELNDYLLDFDKKFNVIPINRTKGFPSELVLEKLHDGHSILLFPEEERTTTSILMEMYPEAGHLSLQTGVSIQPLIIDGAERSSFCNLEGKVKSNPGHPISIHPGEPFDFPENVDDKQISLILYKKMQHAYFTLRSKNEVNLFNEILDAAHINGIQRTIIEDITGTCSYKELLLNTYVMSRALKDVIGSQNVVGLMVPGSIAGVITILSVFRLNKTPAMLNFTSGPKVVSDAVKVASIKKIITIKQFIEKAGLSAVLENLPPDVEVFYLEDIKNNLKPAEKIMGLFDFTRRAKALTADNKLILFTSGSESKPKGVVLGHSSVFNNLQQATLTIDFWQKDRVFNPLPLFHTFGLNISTLLPLIKGTYVFLYPSPLNYKDIPKIICEKGITHLFSTNTFLAAYGKHAQNTDFDSLRYVLSGAEAVTYEVRRLYKEKFGLEIYEGYGCTESSAVLSINTPYAEKNGTVGQFMPGIEYKLEEVEGIHTGGNLLVKGPNLMLGYLVSGKGFVPLSDWHKTGDIINIDSEGYLEIKGRLKRFAKIGGEMVPLHIVEKMANDFFLSESSSAVAIKDSVKGEKIILFINASDANLREFRRYINKQGYSSLYIPSKIIVDRNIAVLGSGKIDYMQMEKKALEQDLILS